jgi:hypothetical protein
VGRPKLAHLHPRHCRGKGTIGRRIGLWITRPSDIFRQSLIDINEFATNYMRLLMALDAWLRKGLN